MSVRKKPLFRRSQFPNGLTLVSERQPRAQSLSIGVWVAAGPRTERPNEIGISHFLEHMVFKGTKKRSGLDIAREMDAVGGEFNAFTAREYTCFHVLLLKRDLELAVDILSDILMNSLFDAEELERERKVILQEIAMVSDTPEELAYDTYYRKIFGKHGIGRDILGSESSVKRIKRANLLRYFRKNYDPRQIVVSVAGDLSHELLRRSFKNLGENSWPGRAATAKSALNSDLVQKTSKIDLAQGGSPKFKTGSWWIKDQSEQVHIIWGVPGFKYNSRYRWAGVLIDTFLGGGMSSLLFQEIRETRGLAYNVYSSLAQYSDTGTFTIYVGTSPSQVSTCLKLIEECTERLTKRLLTKDELKRAKNNVKGMVLLGSDSVDSRMSSIARTELFQTKYMKVSEVCKKIDSIRAEDVCTAAKKLFNQDKSLLFLGPKPNRHQKKRLKPWVSF